MSRCGAEAGGLGDDVAKIHGDGGPECWLLNRERLRMISRARPLCVLMKPISSARRATCRRTALEQLGGAENRLQRVVELVRDAGYQDADGGETLLPHDLALQRLQRLAHLALLLDLPIERVGVSAGSRPWSRTRPAAAPNSWFEGTAQAADRSPRAMRCAANGALSWRDRRPPIHHDTRHDRHSDENDDQDAPPQRPAALDGALGDTHAHHPCAAIDGRGARTGDPRRRCPPLPTFAAPRQASRRDTSIVVPMNRSASRLRASTRPRRSVSVITEPSGRGMPVNRLWSRAD